MLIFCYFFTVVFFYFTSPPLPSAISGDSPFDIVSFLCFSSAVCSRRAGVSCRCRSLSRILFFFLINLFKYKFVDLVVRFLL